MVPAMPPGLVAVILAGAVLVISGCGRSLDDAKIATADLTAQQKRVAHASQAFTTPGSAASFVTTFVRDVGDGAGPALFGVYDRRVPAAVGRANALGALDAMTTAARASLPAVIRTRRTPVGELVVIQLLRTAGDDKTYSFLLRREPRGWRIVYDGMFAEALGNYVLNAVATDPAKPSVEARRAARRAVSALQLATLPSS
jgi:hypothetical protein